MEKKIFIIEDDANILFSLKAKFSIEKFKVEVDTGIDEAEKILNKIKIYKPDYIILDLILPKVDGFQILSKIKGDNETSRTPVFIFTNLSDKENKEKISKMGGDYYFIKSDFTLDEFVEKVKKIIQNKKNNED